MLRNMKPIIGVIAILQILFSIALLLEWAFAWMASKDQLAWQIIEMLEVGEMALAILALASGLILIRYLFQRNRQVEDQLLVASGAFHELMNERFTNWGLTEAEQEIATFTIKGLTIAEIAALRKKSQGTVKAQNNAVYRKAGVSSRTQLLSLFIEDLMAEPLVGQGAAT
ncbi:MAG: LuxR C-terminal-related transcriptional regulator [Salaquimonas sp.]|nr:LuxR C-terminal-related transcriptional regulator [Salaquimonas sp.]